MVDFHIENLKGRNCALVAGIEQIWDTDLFTDCVLVGGGGSRIRCHSILLALASEVFKTILPKPGDDREDTVILLPQLDHQELEITKTLLYFGVVHFDSESKVNKIARFVLENLGINTTSSKRDVQTLMEHKDKVNGLISDLTGDEMGEVTATSIIEPIFEEEEDEPSDPQQVDVLHVFNKVNFEESVTFSINPKASDCSKACHANCELGFEMFTEMEKLQMRTMFKGNPKSLLLSHLYAQERVGLSMESYQILGKRFCLGFLSSELSIGLYLLKEVLKDYWKGIKFYEHGNRGMIKQKPATSVFLAWMKEFAASYGQASPDEDLIILSHWLSKKVLYDVYRDENPTPHLSQSTFYESFAKYFGPNRVDVTLPRIRISKYSSHSVCTRCSSLNTNKCQAKTELELKVAKEKINQHRITFGLARRKVEEIIQSTVSYPEDNIVFQVDSMDNAKSYLPHYVEKTKENQGTERLASKITGCIIYSRKYDGNRKVVFYINHDQAWLLFHLLIMHILKQIIY